MADSKRLESSSTPEVADRDSRAEALLVDGLDRYFAGQYEEAINLWTRVLFLDRSHARARAYIDRARTAMAERQRRSDEMLHQTGELLAGGHTDAARDLLSRAVATGGDDEQSEALRLQLERVERLARARVAPHAMPPAVVDAVPVHTWRRPWSGWLARSTASSRLLLIGVLAGAVLAVGLVAGTSVEQWLGVGASVESLPAVGRTPALAVLSSSETALIRARTLYGRGRLAEALQVLDRVAADSADRAASDRLRVEIQQILLASRRGNSSNSVDVSRGRP